MATISTTKGANRYNNMYTEYAENQAKAVKEQTEQATQSANQQLREAYIGRMQNQKNLNDALTQQGIRGGATETSNIKLGTDYQNTRSNIYKNRDATIKDINTNADQNLLSFKLQNDAAKLAYIEGIEAENREVTRAEDDEKEAKKIEQWTAYYSKFYDIDWLTGQRKGASAAEKAVIDARIGYLREQKKGY